jgi:hypothetical protein
MLGHAAWRDGVVRVPVDEYAAAKHAEAEVGRQQHQETQRRLDREAAERHRRRDSGATEPRPPKL